MQTNTASQRVFKPNVNVQRPSNRRKETRTSGTSNKNMRLYSKSVDVRVISHLNEIVMVQDILYALAADQGKVKQDFLYNLNSTPKLTTTDFEILNTFNELIRCGRRYETLKNFVANLDKSDEPRQKATTHFSKLLEGRNERPEGTNYTYQQGKEVVLRIIKSGYFSRLQQTSYGATYRKIDVKIGQETTIPIDDGGMPSFNDSLNLAHKETVPLTIGINNNWIPHQAKS